MNKEIIDRLTEARIEVTRVYVSLPKKLQIKLELGADSIIQHEIGKLEKHFALSQKTEVKK